jgi:paraquat-inducible protein B
MSKDEKHDAEAVVLPHAIIQKQKGISFVWIIPFVAIIIAAGLVYKAFDEKGPVITITFKSAEGIEAGKTKIKYKDVTIGEIKKIELNADLQGVTVTAELIKEARQYLTEKTHFWVVRTRFSGGVVSGIGTLFSGSYIAIDPGRGGELKKSFKGLEIPPVVMSVEPGRHFQLKAPKLGSLAYGSPIYFKGIKVGQVVGYEFSDLKKELEIKIFIDEPYDRNVVENTRFWFASGLDMAIDAKGVRVDTESFVSMMIGGLAFDTPDQNLKVSFAPKGYTFPLYDSRESAMAKKYILKDYYVLKFDHSVRGLAIGAPVEFRGFPFGEVVDIELEVDGNYSQMKIAVKIKVEPGRLKQFVENHENPGKALEIMVSKGLRAQLKIGNLITGSLYVALDFFEALKPASIIVHNDIIEIPTIPTSIDELTNNLTLLLSNLSKIPVEEIGTATLNTMQNLDATSKSFKKAGDSLNKIASSDSLKQSINSLSLSMDKILRLTSELEQDLPSAINAISKQTIITLGKIDKLTASDSDIIFELKQTLKEFDKAAQSIRILADYLEQHPESLIQGKGEE